jgi:two-component system chemotaxis response regulator CheY
MRILVVDDDPLCRAVIAIPLKAIGGIEITEATDGDQAWILLQGNSYDAVILDWQMPIRSGLEIVKALRATGSRVPVLMVTAEAGKEHVIEAIRAGVSDYLIKPFDSESLQIKLGRLLEKR